MKLRVAENSRQGGRWVGIAAIVIGLAVDAGLAGPAQPACLAVDLSLVKSEVTRTAVANTVDGVIRLGLRLAGAEAEAGAIDRVCAKLATGAPVWAALRAGDGGAEFEFGEGDPPSSIEEWPAHTAAVAAMATRAKAERVFELALDVNRLRGCFEEGFAGGRGGEVLAALRLANARVVGLHGFVIAPEDVASLDPLMGGRGGAGEPEYGGPALVAVVISWSARSEPPGVVRSRQLTTWHWPASVVGPPPAEKVGFAAVTRVVWRPVLEDCVAIYAASLPAAERARFDAATDAWRQSAGSGGLAAAGSFFGGVEPWITWLPAEGGAGKGAEGWLRWRARLREDATLAAARPALAKVLEPLSASLKSDGDGRARMAGRWWPLGAGWKLLPARVGERPSLSGEITVDRGAAPEAGRSR